MTTRRHVRHTPRNALASLLLACCATAHAGQYTVPLFLAPGPGGDPQGVLRLANDADAAATVTIRAIDDAGTATEPATLTLNALAAVELSATELQSGNAAKGLPTGLGALAGEVRLAIDSDLPVTPSAYVRGADGTLTAMNATVLGAVGIGQAAGTGQDAGAGRSATGGRDAHRYGIALFHPASHAAQPSRLRLINPSDAAAQVTIEARDDAGSPAPSGAVRLTLPANGARTLTAQELEAGDGGDAAFAGQLGAGVGNWRLSVSSDRSIEVLHVTVGAGGGWRNLSTTAVDGWAPSDAAAFEARFLSRALLFRNGGPPGGYRVLAGSRAADLDMPDTTIGYSYERVGRDTGRLDLASTGCAFNLYFAAAAEGWHTSACADGPAAGDTGGGGVWTALPPGAAALDLGGPLPDLTHAPGAPLAAVTLPEASNGDGELSYSLSPGVPGLTFDPATRRLAGAPSEAGNHLMTYRARAASGDHDWRTFRLVVRGGGDAQSPTFGAGDTLAGLPAGGWRPEGLANGSFRTSEDGGAVVELGQLGYFDSGGQRYTCLSADGCVVQGQRVAEGSVVRTPLDGGGTDTSPSFAGAAGPGDRTYTVGTAIASLVLPAASGGDGTLTYTLTPGIPGLTFDAATRRLTGTPTDAGTWNVTYTATDTDGDTDSLRFAVTVEAAGGGGSFDFARGFDLQDGNDSPQGIAFANGRFFIVDSVDDKLYAYTPAGQRVPDADFDLQDGNNNPAGIAFANGRFFITDWDDDKVYAYTPDGQRVPDADFDLQDGNNNPAGIAFANGRFFITDWDDDKVYAYTPDGQRIPDADFEAQDSSNGPYGIAFANNRFFIVDRADGKVHAYTPDGQRIPDADFEAQDGNANSRGIAFANGRFFIADLRDARVHAYSASGQYIEDHGNDPASATPAAIGSDTPGGLDAGDSDWFRIDVDAPGTLAVYTTGSVDTVGRLEDASGALVRGDDDSGAGTNFNISAPVAAGTYFVRVEGYHANTAGAYTLHVRFTEADSGTTTPPGGGGTGTGGNGADTTPSFASVTGPVDQYYTVGTAIMALTLPAASGGDGDVTYSLAPAVPGLTFDAATRRLTGTPTDAGTWNVTYTATDADGDTDSLRFAITVEAAGGSGSFDLQDGNDIPGGITFANGRFFITDRDDHKVYAYTPAGQRVPDADFVLQDGNDVPAGIVFANGRFFIVDSPDDKVYAYTPAGQRVPEADFVLQDGNDNPRGIVFANGRFFITDSVDDKVYAYTPAGQRVPEADFVLQDGNNVPFGVAFANGRFFIVDNGDDKVYAYTPAGQRVPDADFEAQDSNNGPWGIAFANGRFFITDFFDDGKVHAYFVSGQRIGPELTVHTVSVSATPLSAGEAFTVSAVVSNVGTLPAGATTLRSFLSTDAQISTGDTEIGAKAIAGLAAYAASEASISSTVPGPTANGCYYCEVCVDAVNGEALVENNCSGSVAVAVGQQTDLSVRTTILDAPEFGSIFDPIRMTVVVSNNGSIASTPKKLNFSGGRTFSVDIPTLAPGERATFDEQVDTVSIGSTTYRACIDYPCDSNVGNNCGSESVSYSFAAAPNDRIGPLRSEIDSGDDRGQGGGR